MRIGQGYDAHRLTPGRPLVLGGVTIPHEQGLLGHSDADVLTHAVCDALLGAAALGDLGTHFPDTDERYQNIRSLDLLAQVGAMLAGEAYGIGNIDVTVVAERPRLSAHIPRMRENLAETLGIDAARVSVKATTTEGMGFTGTGQGISAWATALIRKGNPGD